MSKQVEIFMHIEKLNSDGDVIGCDSVLVVGEYSPAERGSRDYYGQAMEPDLPDSMEILSATTEDGEEIDLGKCEERVALELLWEAIAD